MLRAVSQRRSQSVQDRTAARNDMNQDIFDRHRVRLAGCSEAPDVLVFTHGLGTDQSVWDGVAHALGRDFRTLTYDNAGAAPCNQTYFRANQARYLNVSGYASDLLAIVDAAVPEGRVSLVGHSVGGMASLLAALKRPRFFHRLVMIGSSPRYMDDGDYRGGFTRADIDAVYGALSSDYASAVQHIAALMTGDENSRFAGRFAEVMLKTPPDMMLTTLCAVLQGDRRKDLHQVAVPTLLLQSAADAFVPLPVAEYMQGQIPGSVLRVIEASGHLPHVTAPEAVVEAIRDFLS